MDMSHRQLASDKCWYCLPRTMTIVSVTMKEISSQACFFQPAPNDKLQTYMPISPLLPSLLLSLHRDMSLNTLRKLIDPLT